MRTFIAALALLVAVPAAAQAPTGPLTWSAIHANLSKSSVFLTTESGTCTAFVVNSKATDTINGKERNVDYLLTAAHCDGGKMYVDNRPAEVVAKDVKKDLMVVRVEDLDRPAVKLAKENPKVGDEVASLGYGYGFERPMFRVAHIADDDTYIAEQGIGGPFMTIDASFVPGQSGGPVVNRAGELVMVVQMGTQIAGFGVGAEVVKDKMNRYFEKP